MTETKYWKAPNGSVYFSDSRATDPSGQGWTEVQVASIDAIVIEPAEMPIVKEQRKYQTRTLTIDGDLYMDPRMDEARRLALRYLAIARYLDANPPIDEAQVTALASEIRRTAGDFTPDGVARALIRNGWTKP